MEKGELNNSQNHTLLRPSATSPNLGEEQPYSPSLGETEGGLLKLLSDPSAPVTREWLDKAVREMPYCTLPLTLYLKRNGIAGNEDLLARLAIACPDRRALALQLGEDAEAFAQFYPAEPEPETPDTDTTIDRFLDSFGHTSEKEIQAISQAIFNPMPDYADVLAAQEQGGGDRPAAQTDEDQLIDKFIAQSQERERQVAQAPSQPHVEEAEIAEIAHDNVEAPVQTDDTMFSESLAMSYIASGKFEAALEIIQHISADNPEKSIYFADQIRFLRKLVLNSKLLNQN